MRRTVRVVHTSAIVALALLLAPAAAEAQEPWLVSVEGGFMLPAGEPQADLFGPGLAGAVAIHRPVQSWLSLGLRLRAGFLSDGSPPPEAGRADPGLASLTTLTAALRFRLPGDDPRRGTGPWVDVAGGAGITGDAGRATLEVGAGYGFEIGGFDLGPMARYIHVIEGSNSLDRRDASLILFGAELTFNDARPTAIVEDEPDVGAPGDRDHDGILDPDDGCPDQPEDFDDFEDEDGCPEPDNDGDGILDGDDTCPDDPEDFDDFEDEDGCPDPDNDGDGILDPVDECPNEAEVINGVDDEDGCPDEGLIVMIDDRIVLEERVLFDFERARVKSSASEVILAIVNLWSQHPEWAMVRVEGHADLRGNEAYNVRLSEHRARNVRHSLVRGGITSERIGSAGFGSRRPRDLHRTEQAHARNRRVEFVVVSRRTDPSSTAPAEVADDGRPVSPEQDSDAEESP